MAFRPLPNGAKAVVKFTVNSKEWTNNLWFTKPDYDANDLTVLGQLVDQGYGGAILPLLSHSAAYVRTKMYDMRRLDGETLVFSTNAGPGTDSGDALSSSDSLVLTLYTADRGRSARGRLYVSGIADTDFDDGLYENANSQAIKAVLDAMFAAAAVEGWTPVVASGQHNGVVLTTLQARPITLVYIRSLIPAAQRRRNGRP